MTDSIIVTVLIQRRGMGKQHETLDSSLTEEMPVEPGFACNHAVHPLHEHDLDEQGHPIEPCGWCRSQGWSGDWRPVEIVQHEICGEWFVVGGIAAHIQTCEYYR